MYRCCIKYLRFRKDFKWCKVLTKRDCIKGQVWGPNVLRLKRMPLILEGFICPLHKLFFIHYTFPGCAACRFREDLRESSWELLKWRQLKNALIWDFHVPALNISSCPVMVRTFLASTCWRSNLTFSLWVKASSPLQSQMLASRWKPVKVGLKERTKLIPWSRNLSEPWITTVKPFRKSTP